MHLLKTVVYISYDGMTDPLGQSQVLPYITELAAMGYRMHLISFEKKERFERSRELIQEWCATAGIQWYPQHYTKRPPLLSTLWDLRRMKREVRRLHKIHSFDIIHCRSYISALTGLFMKRRHGCTFLFDMRGFWADERVDGNIWNLSNPVFRKVYQYFKRKELEFLKEADHIVSLTHNAEEEMRSWELLKDVSLPITVIPCCVDLKRFHPDQISKLEQSALRGQLGLSATDFILGYVGSIGTWYMLPEMLDFFKALKANEPNARFLFVTAESPEIIRDTARRKNLDPNDIIIASTPHSGVPLHISLFDLSVFFIRPSYSKKASSPTKQGEIMAMGIPLVCNSGVGDTDFIVRKYGSGVVLQNLNPESYTGIPKPSDFSSDKLIAGAADYFSLEKGVKSYATIYQSLTRNP